MFVYKVTAFVLFIPVLLAKLHVTTSHILIWRLCLINKRFIGFITQTMKSYRDSPNSPSLEILINQTINSLSAQSTPNTHRERDRVMNGVTKWENCTKLIPWPLFFWIDLGDESSITSQIRQSFSQILTFPPPTLVPVWREEIFKLLLNCRSLTVMSVIMS